MAKQKEPTAFKGVSAKVDYYLSLYDRNVAWLAKALSVSQATLYKKLKHPEKITLGDIKDISEVFKVDMKEFGVIV